MTTPPSAAPAGIPGSRPYEPDLRHHGDAEVRGADAALTDLAVNVRT
ncbi:aminotransferase, partial [Streptomyces sp. SID5471]|nr:aminotransferase [Streptomyces sp. SID5471]